MRTALFLVGLGSFLLYFPMEKRKTKSHFLKTSLDKKIPFLSIFVIPYILFFPYVFGIFVWAFVGGSPLFSRLALSLIFVSIVTTIIYLGYPSMIVRPFARGKRKIDSVTDRLVKKIEEFDRPNNVFPSNHVAYTLTVTLFAVAVLPAYSAVLWLIFCLIAASTVLIKQHYIVDIPSGALVSFFAWIMAGLIL